MQWTAVCFTLLVACLGTAYSNRCVENLYNDVLQCFSDQGLDFLVEAGQQDPNELMREAQAIDPKIQCQQIDLYKDAIGCAMQSLRGCLSLTGMSGALPDINKFRQGMDALCQKYDQFDYKCLRDNYMDILMCGQNKMKEVVKQSNDESKSLSINDIICTSADINFDCSRAHLQNCGNSTLVMYLEQLDKYQVPSACLDKRPGRPGRMVYISNGGNSLSCSTSTSTSVFLATLVSMATAILLGWGGRS